MVSDSFLDIVAEYALHARVLVLIVNIFRPKERRLLVRHVRFPRNHGNKRCGLTYHLRYVNQSYLQKKILLNISCSLDVSSPSLIDFENKAHKIKLAKYVGIQNPNPTASLRRQGIAATQCSYVHRLHQPKGLVSLITAPTRVKCRTKENSKIYGTRPLRTWYSYHFTLLQTHA